MADPALPPGFVLEEEITSSDPPLPPGFVIEEEAPLEIDIVGGEVGAAPTAQEMESLRNAPVDGMSGIERFTAGVGSALDAGYRGVKQLGTSVIGELAGDRTGLTDGQNAITDWAARTGAEQLAENTEIRRLNQPLLDTGAGLAGNITGNVAMMIAPGGVASMGARVPQLAAAAPALTRFGAAILPETITGNALAAGGMGLAAPLAEGDSRPVNAGLSFLAGAGGAAAPRVLGWAGGEIAGLSPAFTANAQQRAAGEVIERFAQDPAAVRQRLATSQVIVPGTLPTLAEATEDVGLSALQKSMSMREPMGGLLRLQAEGNNAARVAAIEGGFGGANASAAEAVENARNLAARQTLRPIGSISVGDTAPVTKAVNRLLEKNAASPTVTGVLSQVQSMIPNIKTVQDAHLVRQELGNLMSGRVEGAANGKLAQKELIVIRDILDRQMKQAFPDWGKFLREYKEGSRELGQINMGEALLEKGPNMRAVGDVPILSGAKFAGAANDLDRVARQATGFKKAKAADIATPDQLRIVDEVRRDLERAARSVDRARPLGGGSDTFKNAIGGNTVQDAMGPIGAAAIDPTMVSPMVLLGLNSMRKNFGEKVAGIVEEAILEPNRAAEILAKLPSQNRRKIVQTVGYLLNQSGSVGGRVPATE